MISLGLYEYSYQIAAVLYIPTRGKINTCNAKLSRGYVAVFVRQWYLKKDDWGISNKTFRARKEGLVVDRTGGIFSSTENGFGISREENCKCRDCDPTTTKVEIVRARK